MEISAEERLRAGDVEGALEGLQAQVRADPSNAKHRLFLFQLLSVLGQWDRALNQLNVVGDLDTEALTTVMIYRPALQAEALRAAIYAGKQAPLIFGEPEAWLAPVIEALRIESRGHHDQAAKLREEAFADAPATSGTLNGERFEWIADGDSRLGPVLEAVVDGKFFWVPYHRIHKIELEEPTDLRDLVWNTALFTWANGGQGIGLIPTRYPGSESSADDQIRLAKKTEWEQVAADCYHGKGQRMLATDAGEFALLDVRELVLDTATSAEATDG